MPDRRHRIAVFLRAYGDMPDLADELGRDYVVLDFHDAPASTDVLLVNPVSPQLLGRLRDRYPRARVIVTEIDDEELGATHAGPVSRLLDAGATAYLPPQDISGVAANVHAYLTEAGRLELTSSSSDTAPHAARRLVE